MDDTLTTMNGPLHGNNTAATSTQDRAIVAFYSSPADAAAARDMLVANGIAGDRVTVQPAADDKSVDANLRPADQSIVGQIREAILPDESSKLPREAVQHGQTILSVTPDKEDAEKIVDVLQTTQPRHFDARLERWRNTV